MASPEGCNDDQLRQFIDARMPATQTPAAIYPPISQPPYGYSPQLPPPNYDYAPAYYPQSSYYGGGAYPAQNQEYTQPTHHDTRQREQPSIAPPGNEDEGILHFDDEADQTGRRQMPWKPLGAVVLVCALAGGVSYETMFKHEGSTSRDGVVAPVAVATGKAQPKTQQPSPSLKPSTSVSPTETASGSGSATATTPTTIPALKLSGINLGCENIATIDVSESVPVYLSASNLLKSDKRIYNLPSSDVTAPLSGTITVQACVKDASKVITPDGTTKGAYDAAFNNVSLNFETSELMADPKLATDPTTNNVPAILVDLCNAGAEAQANKQQPTPAENQACQDKQADWSDSKHPPVSDIVNQLTNQVSAEKKNITTAEMGALLGQIDSSPTADSLEQPIKDYLRDGLKPVADKQLGKLATGVYIDQFTGDPAKQQPAYLKANTNTELASKEQATLAADKKVKAYLAKHPKSTTDLPNLLSIYRTQYPKTKLPAAYADDNPDDMASPSITVTDTVKNN